MQGIKTVEKAVQKNSVGFLIEFQCIEAGKCQICSVFIFTSSSVQKYFLNIVKVNFRVHLESVFG